MPVNFYRLINDNIDNIYPEDTNEYLTYKYILDQIDYILSPDVTKLICMTKNEINDINCLKNKDQQRYKTLLKIGLYEYLSPKRCILEYKLTKYKFDQIVNDIIKNFKKCTVQPGEMVGCLAAQMIGEPSTQMSCSLDEKILILKYSKKTKQLVSVYNDKIGEFIDNIIERNPKKTFNTGFEDSVETILEDEEFNYYITGVDKQERVKYNKISHVSRHPANGNLMKITTRSGREVTTTLTHSHLKRTVYSVEPVLGKDLKIGNRIPVAKNIKNDIDTIDQIIIGDKIINLDEKFGWFIGAYLAEGSISNNTISISNINKIYQDNTKYIGNLFDKDANVRIYEGEYGPSITTSFNQKDLASIIIKYCGNGSFNKKVPSFAYAAPLNFIKGLLRGYFDGDGNINNDSKHHEIRACSRSKELIRGLGLLYSYFGIFVTYKTEKNKRGSDLYHLTIPYKFAEVYKREIGTDLENKENH